jgi:hypothetical protein
MLIGSPSATWRGSSRRPTAWTAFIGRQGTNRFEDTQILGVEGRIPPQIEMGCKFLFSPDAFLSLITGFRPSGVKDVRIAPSSPLNNL